MSMGELFTALAIVAFYGTMAFVALVITELLMHAAGWLENRRRQRRVARIRRP